MTLPTILLWIEEHPVLFSVIGIAAPICFKNLRKIPGLVFRAIQKWISKDRIAFQDQMRKEVKEANADRKEFRSELAAIRDMADRADKALFNGGEKGMFQQMQLMTAYINRSLEIEDVPLFTCDHTGRNFFINSAYRKVVGLTSDDSLDGTKWKGVLHGESAEPYLHEFDRCAEAGEDFYREIELQNPITGEYRGKWRVIAPVYHTGNGNLWIGTFSYALDDKAKDLADMFNLEVKRQ